MWQARNKKIFMIQDFTTIPPIPSGSQNHATINVEGDFYRRGRDWQVDMQAQPYRLGFRKVDGTDLIPLEVISGKKIEEIVMGGGAMVDIYGAPVIKKADDTLVKPIIIRILPDNGGIRIDGPVQKADKRAIATKYFNIPEDATWEEVSQAFEKSKKELQQVYDALKIMHSK
jgi:hypothetical protein